MDARLNVTLCGVILALVANVAQAVVLPLESRLGGLAYYDPNLDITWAADANINGLDHWGYQVPWATGLTIGGISGWRLPSADVNGDDTVVNCLGGGVTGCADNEMGYLYWEEGINASTPGPFSNVQGTGYWSGTDYAADPAARAWYFIFGAGNQSQTIKDSDFYAWAVYTGDVSAVPVPAAVWLFGSGLTGLLGVSRRKKAA